MQHAFWLVKHRLTGNQFGNPQSLNFPYRQSITYDAYSQMTSRQTLHWGGQNDFTAAFAGGRKQAVGYQTPVYDAAGNLLDSGYETGGNFQRVDYDAANRPLKTKTGYRERTGIYVYWKFENETGQLYDGDGRPLKIILRRELEPLGQEIQPVAPPLDASASNKACHSARQKRTGIDACPFLF